MFAVVQPAVVPLKAFRIRFESLCFTICIFICFWYYKLDIDGEEYI